MASAKDAGYMPSMPRVLVVDPGAPDVATIAEAVRVLRAGGLVALPTETVYGLGVRALDERAVEGVFRAKGRPSHHPLIAHVLDEERARDLAASWPEQASRLVRAFWPGPLTIVVGRAPRVPPAMAGGGDSIAIRAPSHPVARAVIGALGEPVAAPSANRYQGLSPTTAQHVVKQLGDAVDLVLDAGPCDTGIESTVIDLRGAVARVLRHGALDTATLRGILPDLESRTEDAREDQPRASPGMAARHYAPRAALLLARTRDEAQRLARGLASNGKRVGLMVRSPPAAASAEVLVRELPDDPAEYGRALYRTLHDLDDLACDAIVVQGVPSDEAWWAIADRLRRASERN
jgi:L-threonylcarbamoyladenylate synthase